jgi:hypothetical protein
MGGDFGYWDLQYSRRVAPMSRCYPVERARALVENDLRDRGHLPIYSAYPDTR